MRLICISALLVAAAVKAQISPELRKAVMKQMENEAERFASVSQRMWDEPELGFEERKAAALLQRELQSAGFKLDTNIGGRATAFAASWGRGAPVIALFGEFDALPNASQEALPERRPRPNHSAGHACGHNLLAAAVAHAAIAVRRVIDEQKLPGTVRFYGTPAEEGGGGKIHMLRAGVFKDVDAGLTWHPASVNFATAHKALAIIIGRFAFEGTASHMTDAPERVRSATDAALITAHALDLLRSHVPAGVDMKYKLRSAEAMPTIGSTIELTLRGPQSLQVVQTFDRAVNCARAGALASGTKMTHQLLTHYADSIFNHALTLALDRNLREVGGYVYSTEEQGFADAIAKTLDGRGRRGAHAMVLPPALQGTSFASTDAADLSWHFPVARIAAATWVAGTPPHAWQATAASGMSIGHKGMLVAAKTLAVTALDLFTGPELLRAAQDEFRKTTAGHTYQSVHP